MAITLRHTRPLTDEEILEFSDRNPGYQFERSAEGDLIVTPASGESSRGSAEVLAQLAIWNRGTHAGVVFDSSGGFHLPDGTLFVPDASWIRRDRWDALTAEQRNAILRLSPDVAFEVRSPSNTLVELQEKMRRYLANGVGVAMLVDPYARKVEVYRPGRDPETFVNPARVSLDPDLPGFALDLQPIFVA